MKKKLSKIKISEKSGTILHFFESLLCNLIEDSWIVISTYAFNLLYYVVLVELYMRKIRPHTNILLGKEVLI